MDKLSAAETYRQSSIENAPPAKIVRLLFEGALRFLGQASAEDPEDPCSDFLYYVGKVDAIVSELRLAIDKELEDEVTQNLECLYLFCERELGLGALERTTQRLEGVRKVLEILLDAWRQVEVEDRRVA